MELSRYMEEETINAIGIVVEAGRYGELQCGSVARACGKADADINSA